MGSDKHTKKEENDHSETSIYQSGIWGLDLTAVKLPPKLEESFSGLRKSKASRSTSEKKADKHQQKSLKDLIKKARKKLKKAKKDLKKSKVAGKKVEKQLVLKLKSKLAKKELETLEAELARIKNESTS